MRVVRIVTTRWVVIFHCGSYGLMPGHSARDLWSEYCLFRKSVSRQCCVFYSLSPAAGVVVPLVVYLDKGNGSSEFHRTFSFVVSFLEEILCREKVPCHVLAELPPVSFTRGTWMAVMCLTHAVTPTTTDKPENSLESLPR